ncbi:GNAT family N-acetyltransferase [Pseudosulfitobacter sp. DSM 107133]|uniref:GNAT family N-acetyltransferase n=1 Tax=Pseudosulfitobacter sp. DSM 107133 TaxID=2883100 RepID=UPI000DF29B1A|nr:GNAT family N-acetyltransferase [Pseudosulfitobacter sp. DSM 107133]UOA25846.1 hypothetical protein DSM107133_00534 [Pseudosulfitobacter sp. DSM 107133]
MNESATTTQFVTEPFDPHKHDRAAFSCGVEQVDNYFKKTANKLSKADNVRTYVKVSADDKTKVEGFYATNAHSVYYEDLPKKYMRGAPAHGSIPAVYISMMGRDITCKGKGMGAVLLADALKRIALGAERFGVAVVLLDVLDCGDPKAVEQRKQTYEKYGFQPLPSEDLRMFLPLATVRQLLGV